ncbi:MAG: DNA polymerase III subunit beta [bacterium]|nr:DNA polymerase III subunit beta [bacterium]
MKIIVGHSETKRALTAVARSVSRRGDLPILTNICVHKGEGELTFSATDLVTAIQYTIPAQGEGSGMVCVPAMVFVEFVHSLPETDITLHLEDGKLSIHSGSFTATIQGARGEDFPTLPIFDSEKAMFIAGKTLRETIERVSLAASTDESRREMTGILLTYEKGVLSLVATDGYRLSKSMVSVDKSEGNMSFILPARSMMELARLIGENDKTLVGVIFQGSQVLFSIERVTLVSSLIDGQFPPYERILPGPPTTRLMVERDVLEKAVRLAGIFSRAVAGVVRLTVTPKKTPSLTLSSSIEQIGTQEGSIDASVEGEELVIALNSRYLLDAIHATKASQVALEFSGALKPCKISGIGEEGVFHIIMPVRLQG